jgi:hypothetical protein
VPAIPIDRVKLSIARFDAGRLDELEALVARWSVVWATSES